MNVNKNVDVSGNVNVNKTVTSIENIYFQMGTGWAQTKIIDSS